MNKPQSLAAKVLAVSRSIGAVEKNGLNAHFKFKYQAWDDVLPAVRNACCEHGVQITPTVLDARHDNGHVIVHMMFIVKDADSDQVDEFAWFGESKGSDDKGIQKAITSCTKYALLKYLMIPIVDDTDTDAHGPAKAATAKPAAKPTEVTVEDARAVLRKKVQADWHEIGGTTEDLAWIRSIVPKSLNILDLVNAAINDEGCQTVDDVRLYVEEVSRRQK
jgi:hypothetical protein